MSELSSADRDRAESLLPEAIVAHYPDVVDEIAAAIAAAREEGRQEVRAELRSPCRNCSSRALLDGWHAYGNKKCCPDCDHRAAVAPAQPADGCRTCGAPDHPSGCGQDVQRFLADRRPAQPVTRTTPTEEPK